MKSVPPASARHQQCRGRQRVRVSMSDCVWCQDGKATGWCRPKIWYHLWKGYTDKLPRSLPWTLPGADQEPVRVSTSREETRSLGAHGVWCSLCKCSGAADSGGCETEGAGDLGRRAGGPELKELDCECKNVLCFHHRFSC